MFTFGSHIETITASARQMIGYIKRVSNGTLGFQTLEIRRDVIDALFAYDVYVRNVTRIVIPELYCHGPVDLEYCVMYHWYRSRDIDVNT